MNGPILKMVHVTLSSPEFRSVKKKRANKFDFPRQGFEPWVSELVIIFWLNSRKNE